MIAGRRLPAFAVLVCMVAYSCLSHFSHAHPETRDLATGLALAPMVTLGAVTSYRTFGAIVAAMIACAGVVLLYGSWAYLAAHFTAVYLVQQAGFYTLLAASFGFSLRAGHTPVCTRLADRLHGPLTAREISYSRGVTIAWVVFFGANAMLAVILFEFVPLAAWSFFVNFLSLPIVLLVFLGEYCVRRRVLPSVSRGALLATLRVYFAARPEAK